MANRNLILSGTGKEYLDILCDRLDVERPQGLKIAFAKGISNAQGNVSVTQNEGNKQNWAIPDGIIREKEYLLFKHLIINELQTSLSDDEVNKQMLNYMEFGLRVISNELKQLSSMEDYRIKVLS